MPSSLPLRLSKHTILHKDFNQKIRGYDPTEVDEFLDIVIKDYTTFSKAIGRKNDQIKALRKQVDKLKNQPRPRQQPIITQNQQQYAGYQQNANAVRNPNGTVPPQSIRQFTPDQRAYQDVLQRLDQIETRVFGRPLRQPVNMNYQRPVRRPRRPRYNNRR